MLRTVIYSAFWDDAHTVKELLKYGCDVQCLDHLIFSEYLGMLRETGYCVMPSLISAATINELRDVFELEPKFDSVREVRRFASPEGGPSSAVSAPAPAFAS